MKQRMTRNTPSLPRETVVVIDNALQAREATGRPIRWGWSGRLHGPGSHQPDHEQRPRHAHRGHLQPHAPRAENVYRYSGLEDIARVDTQGELDAAVSDGRPAVTDDPMLMCRSPHIDVIVDVTGSVEFGANVFMEAFAHGKHVVMMNAEVDATIGPILQTYAKRAGVTLSACDGDEPGLQMNLYRWVAGLGLIPGSCATSRASRTHIGTRRRSRRGPSAGSRTRRWSPRSDGTKMS